MYDVIRCSYGDIVCYKHWLFFKKIAGVEKITVKFQIVIFLLQIQEIFEMT